MKLVLLYFAVVHGWQAATVRRTSGMMMEVQKGMTLRSRILTLVTRGWIREAMSRGQLKVGSLDTVEACDSNIIHIVANDVRWMTKTKKTALQFRHVDAHLDSLHSRVLTRGKKGGVVATISATASDLDSSSLWQQLLLEQIAPKLGITGVTTAKTYFDQKRRRISIHYGQDAMVSFRLESTNDGRLIFRDPDISFSGQSPFFYEALAELVLSTVLLDASAALRVDQIDFVDNYLKATIISSDRTYIALQQQRKLQISAKDAATKTSAATASLRGTYDQDDDIRYGRVSVHATASSQNRKNKHVPWPLWSALMPRDLRPTLTVPPRRLPWLLAPTNSAPRLVVCAFFILGILIQVTSIPEEIFALVRTAPKVLTSLSKTLSHCLSKTLSSILSFFVNSALTIVKSPKLLCTQMSTLILSLIPRPAVLQRRWWQRKFPFFNAKKKPSQPPQPQPPLPEPLTLSFFKDWPSTTSPSSWFDQFTATLHNRPGKDMLALFPHHAHKFF